MVTTKPTETATKDETQEPTNSIDDDISMDSTSTANANSWFSSGASGGILPSFVIGGRPDGMGGGDMPPNGSGQRSWTPLRVFAELRQRLRPWIAEFFLFKKFGLPPNVVSIAPRIKRNLQYFLTNYLCLFLVLLVYCILTSILMLVTLLVLGGLFYTIYQRTQKGPVVISGFELPPSLLYTLALLVCFPLFAFADVGGVMYWVIGSSIFLILAHAFFYSSEEVPGAEFEVGTVVA